MAEVCTLTSLADETRPSFRAHPFLPTGSIVGQEKTMLFSLSACHGHDEDLVCLSSSMDHHIIIAGVESREHLPWLLTREICSGP